MKTLIAALMIVASMARGAEVKPNILFILVDDQRSDTLGCAGHPIVKTPTIDSLAARGVRFENAFVTTPICAASRASFLTGLTERTHGYTFGKPPINKEDLSTSYPILLRKQGYRVGLFGKYGVKGATSPKELFDEFKNLTRSPYFKKTPTGKRHVGEIIGDAGVQFIKTQPAGKPFCLSICFNISHAEDRDRKPGSGHYPWPKSVDGMYDDIKMPLPRLGDPKYFKATPKFLQNSMNYDRYLWRWDTPEKYQTNLRAYFRMLTGMDKIVARILKSIEDKGVLQNTVVFYMGDNGYYMGDRGFAGKWSHYEQALRVPLIIADPRLPKAKQGRVVKPMALNIDIPATFLDVAGAKQPAIYQGRSLTPILAGKEPGDWRTDFFCEHHMNHKRIPKWEGVRNQRFKYAMYYEEGEEGELLYDMEKDPDELVNVARNPEYKAQLVKMRARCEEFREQYPKCTNKPRPRKAKKKKK